MFEPLEPDTTIALRLLYSQNLQFCHEHHLKFCLLDFQKSDEECYLVLAQDPYYVLFFEYYHRTVHILHVPIPTYICEAMIQLMYLKFSYIIFPSPTHHAPPLPNSTQIQINTKLNYVISICKVHYPLHQDEWRIIKEKSCFPVHIGFGFKIQGVGIFPSQIGRCINKFIICQDYHYQPMLLHGMFASLTFSLLISSSSPPSQIFLPLHKS
ncbi:hypothetical protein AGLY_005806 [Aphis glycines]|uniref:Uncharacterized protein n=1 Tax=Aphis glycines TaxID=307491 RepID=A0A6G0TS44_APHGL|nr:hypothetical protein AGLY_005806 [Aphis glycines]